MNVDESVNVNDIIDINIIKIYIYYIYNDINYLIAILNNAYCPIYKI